MTTPSPAAVAAAQAEISDAFNDAGTGPKFGTHVQLAIDAEKAPLVAALEEIAELTQRQQLPLTSQIHQIALAAAKPKP